MPIELGRSAPQSLGARIVPAGWCLTRRRRCYTGTSDNVGWLGYTLPSSGCPVRHRSLRTGNPVQSWDLLQITKTLPGLPPISPVARTVIGALRMRFRVRQGREQPARGRDDTAPEVARRRMTSRTRVGRRVRRPPSGPALGSPGKTEHLDDDNPSRYVARPNRAGG